MSIVFYVPETISKSVGNRPGEQEIRRRLETIKSITLLRSARIFRKVLEIWRYMLLHRLL